jgi:hypothetical protein
VNAPSGGISGCSAVCAANTNSPSATGGMPSIDPLYAAAARIGLVIGRASAGHEAQQRVGCVTGEVVDVRH